MARPSEVNGALVTDCGLLRSVTVARQSGFLKNQEKQSLQWTEGCAPPRIFVCFGDLRLVEAAGFRASSAPKSLM